VFVALSILAVTLFVVLPLREPAGPPRVPPPGPGGEGRGQGQVDRHDRHEDRGKR
jgi:hypothetical protein